MAEEHILAHVLREDVVFLKKIKSVGKPLPIRDTNVSSFITSRETFFLDFLHCSTSSENGPRTPELQRQIRKAWHVSPREKLSCAALHVSEETERSSSWYY
jgi:hypothetical protein